MRAADRPGGRPTAAASDRRYRDRADSPMRPAASRSLLRPTAVMAFVLASFAALLPVTVDVVRALHWHFTQETTVEGGIELLLLWPALALAASLPRAMSLRAMLAIAIALLYLRRHHVDVPLLVVLIYVEGLIAAGCLVLARQSRQGETAPMHDIAAFVLGMMTMALVLWSASALGFGRPWPLAMLAFALAAASLAIARRRPLTLRLAALWIDPARSRGETWLGAALVAWFLSLFARTNNVVEYDSLWYALRLPQVLVGERSLFEPLGLVSPVHYFPKLYESLMLPLAAFGDFSFQVGLSIAMLGLTAMMAVVFLRSVGLGTTLGLLGALTLITIPAFSNMALAAKPDLFAATLLLGAAMAAWSVGRGADARQLGWVFALVLLAACAKINTVIYGAAIFGAAAVAVLKGRGGAAAGPDGAMWPSAAAGLAVALSLPLALIVTARTWVLAGVPTIGPEQLVAIWSGLGMQIRLPAGTLNWTAPAGLSGIPALIVDLLFRPSRLEHIVITWVGNAWAILPLAGAAVWLAGGRDPRPPTWVWWPAILAGLAFALGTQFLVRGGDGNYFLLPLALATLLTLAWIGRITPRGWSRAALFAALLAISVWQASYAFVSAAWSQPGTRSFDLKFGRSPLDTKKMRANVLRTQGLAEIEGFLRAQGGRSRVVGVWPADESGLHWLSARAEGLATVSYSHPGFVDDAEGFRTFLRLAAIDYLIVPADGAAMKEGELRAGVRAWLDEVDWRRAIVAGGDRYALIDVRAAGN